VTSILDAWRAVDPQARLVSGSVEHLTRPVRGVVRTRAAPPHLPDLLPGQLLVAEAGVLSRRLDELVSILAEAGLEPAAVWVMGDRPPPLERAGADLPVLAGLGTTTRLASQVSAYLDAERTHLTAVSAEIRLATAEAALVDPQPGAPAGVLAARLRRGVAVTTGGSLAAVHPRPAGVALATRFVATHARLLEGRASRPSAARRTRDGLYLLERLVMPDATAWLFDDIPFAASDEVGLEALAITLRALLRRSAPAPAGPRAGPRLPPSTGDPLRDTLLAVARANGRIAPAARSLGVHRNTVLYRLRRAAAESGIDPRRPDDAIRLMRDADRSRAES
jgi:hypothetical protein